MSPADSAQPLTLGDLSPNTALLMCGHCFHKERELRLVSFDDDEPQATCDLDHDTEDAVDAAKLIGLHHLFDWEPGLGFLRDLKLGQTAWKSGPDTWTIEDDADED